MSPHDPNPTETILGTTYEREDLLRQEAHNGRAGCVTRRVGRWVRPIARVAFVLLVAVILADTVVEPGEAIGWIATVLIPTLVVLGVVVGTIFLVAWQGGKVYDTRYPRK